MINIIVRRCRISSNSYCKLYFSNIAKKRSLSYSLVTRSRSNSTTTTIVDTILNNKAEQTKTATKNLICIDNNKKSKEEEDIILVTACDRAKELSNLTLITTTATSKENNKAVISADELLDLTHHRNFSHFLWSNDSDTSTVNELEKKKKVQLTLHYAFISMTSWLLQVIAEEAEKEILLKKAIQLMIRAEQLKIPISLPLYSKLSSCCAMYLPKPTSSIIRISLSLKRSKQQPVHGNEWCDELFCNTFLTLFQSKNYVAAIELFPILKSMHGYSIHYTHASRLLQQLESCEEIDQDNSTFKNALIGYLQLPIEIQNIKNQSNKEYMLNQIQDLFIALNDDDIDDIPPSNNVSNNKAIKSAEEYDFSERFNWDIDDVTEQFVEDQGSYGLKLSEEYEIYHDRHLFNYDDDDFVEYKIDDDDDDDDDSDIDNE